MKRILLFCLLILTGYSVYSQCDLYSDDCSGFPSSSGNTTGFTRTQGTTYTCTSGDYSWYTSGSTSYFATPDIDVPQGKSITINVKSKKASGYSGQPEVYIRVTGYYSFGYQSWQLPNNNSWVKVGNISSFNCSTGATITVPSAIVGGQKVSVCFFPKNASSTNWWAIDNICISSATGSAVPTTYEEKFPYGSKWYPESPYVKIPYHSYISASNGYVYLWGGGVEGTLDQYAAFYTGYDNSSPTHIITQEINTSNYVNGEIRYAFKALYPCNGPAGFTFDEDYSNYTPKLYVQQGQYDNNNWIELPVNSYFPNGKWQYASYDISDYKAQNVKFKFERGGFCTNPAEGIDNIRVFDRDCKISTLECSVIEGPENPEANINLQYSVQPIPKATYYRWVVRSGGNLYYKAPYIVSGQGTTNVTVNFGNLPAPVRVICIPYDADLSNGSTDTSIVCHAKLSHKQVSVSACSNLSINNHPTDTEGCTGGTASFTADVTGSSPVYQWLKNGNVITEGTNSALSLNNLKLSDAGNYSCIVTNSCSSATTNSAVLTVNPGVEITAQPQNLSVCAASTADFSVDATGTGNLSYSWYKEQSLITNETNATLTLLAVTEQDAGNYHCVISGSCGIVSTQSATLSVSNTINIVSQPANQTKCVGASAAFVVNASGNDILYQWKKNDVNITDKTTSVYSIPLTAFSDTASYKCELKNACGIILTATAKLILNDTNLIITTQPQTISSCEAISATLEVLTNATSGVKYQWYKGNKIIANSTNNTYTVDSLTKFDEDFFFCRVNNACKTIYTDTVFLLVELKPFYNASQITLQKLVGESVRFSTSPQGTVPFTYQWRKDNVIISGATKSFYEINNLVLADAGIYACDITNMCGGITKNIATLIIKNYIPNTYLLDGYVNYNNTNATPISQVKIYLLDNETKVKLDSVVTDTNGYYEFINVPNGLYEVKPLCNKVAGGIEPSDALAANKYYVGTLGITDQLKYKAADVNGDSKVNTTDALMILRRYLLIIKTFPVGNWLFVTEPVSIEGVDKRYDFQGICFGDVNGSYIPPID